MTGTRPGSVDPFRCYLGKQIPLRNRLFVIERCEIHGRDLFFRARHPESGEEALLTVLELMGLDGEPRPAP